MFCITVPIKAYVSVDQLVKLRCKLRYDVCLGVKPGGNSSGSGRRQTASTFPGNSSTRRTCPVINCGRVYDNIPLLDGHLKR